ncbi:FAD-dependent monooxygenase [Amycolatopsis cihanbeyliensis]
MGPVAGLSAVQPNARVAVLGAGPVGQTTALLLARWGVPTVVLDQRPERDLVGSRAICQQRDVLDIWDAVGAGERIAAEGVTWLTARTFYRDRELFAYDLPDPGRSPFPPFVNLSQARTEEILDERIAAEPLIELRWDHRVTGITQDSGGVRLDCATAGGRRTVTADYAVACAGARAEDLRRMLGVSFPGQSFDDLFLICDIRADLPGFATERRFHFDPSWNPGRQVLIHPCPGSSYRIDWQVPPGYDLAAEEAAGALDRRIRTVIGERDYHVLWRSVYRFHERLADRMRVGRVLLAGDCAHLVAPFGARGLNSGVQDAENAAWKLAFVLSGRAGEELLESYHTERHAAAVENIDVTSSTMRFLVPGDEADRARRESILDSAVGDPAVRSEVDSGRLAEPFWYAGSPLTTPSTARPCTGRPARGTAPVVAPGVLVPDVAVSVDGAPSRLRSLARDGFLLLAAGGTAAAAGAAVPARGTPTRVLRIEEIDAAGELAAALSPAPGEVWVLRPDAHIAAVLAEPTTEEIATALRRCLGRGPGPL